MTALEDAYCTGTTSGTAIVRRFPVPSTPEISQNQNVLTSSACCGNQWYLNSEIIPGANQQSYTAQISGMYTVVVTLNSCSSEPSEAVDLLVGIIENKSEAFKYWPNPANDKLNIRCNELKGNFKVKFYSAPGLFVKNCSISGFNDIITVDIHDLVPGLYFIIINDDENIFSGKLMVR